MPSAFCLVKTLSDKFKRMLKSGEVDIRSLSKMSSLERREFFLKEFGERNAQEINALFESKLLLKNQQRGLVNWAKQVTGISEAAKRDMVEKIGRMTTVLDPKTEDAFLNDLASKRLGTEVTYEEAQKILELSNKVQALKNYSDEAGRMAYGESKIDLMDYVNSLNPKKANLTMNIAGIPRATMASLDLSAPLNQGWGMLSRKEFYTSLGQILRYAKSEKAFKQLQADIITRETYKRAKRAGLRLTDLGDNLVQREEAFMTTLLDKIPGMRGSQRAYTGFLNKLRMDVFDNLIKKAEVAGEDVGLGSKALEDIAKVVNNFTGGARVGKTEGAVPFLNAILFSPRKIASTLQMLNPINYINPKISKTAKKAAFRQLVGSAAMTMGIINLLKVIYGDDASVEADSRSSDFGKIKVGRTRVDLSGGNASYATLISRLVSNSTKNVNTGEVKKLGEGYGSQTGRDLISQFMWYKTSPNASFIIDALTGKNVMGQEKTVPQAALDKVKPMFANSFVELLKSDTKGKALLAILALFGGGLNTFEPPKEKPKKAWK